MTVREFEALGEDREVYLVKLVRKLGPELERQRPQLSKQLHEYLFRSDDGGDLVWIKEEHKNVQFGEVIYDVDYYLDGILESELWAGRVYTTDGSIDVEPVDMKNVQMEQVLRYVVAKYPPPPPSFEIHNATKKMIKSVIVSKDGKKYVKLQIGKPGIAPDTTGRVIWYQSTLAACGYFVKVVFEDSNETEPGKFDFCEEDITDEGVTIEVAASDDQANGVEVVPLAEPMTDDNE